MSGPGWEGRVRIRLHPGADRIERAEVGAERPLRAGRGFIGRAPEEVAGLVPRVFAVCGVAQTVAALGALEQASGRRPGAVHLAARALAVAAETAREHLVRILWQWPSQSGGAPRKAVARRAHGLVRKVLVPLFPDGDFSSPRGLAPDPGALGEAREELRELVEGDALGMPGSAFLALAEPAGLADWATAAGPDLPGVLGLGPVLDSERAGWGRSETPPLPEPEPPALAARLAADADGSFCCRPEWDGQPRETTALTRRSGHPLIAAVLACHGPGLLARRLARLVELAALLEEWPRMEAALSMDGEAPDPDGGLPPGTGLGRAEAARGRLYHWAAVADGRVVDYRILAPTEWNFHPEGPVARGLTGARLSPGTEAREAAGALVEAVDPCVAHEIEVVDA